MKDNKLIKGIEFGDMEGEVNNNQEYLNYVQSQQYRFTEEDIINNKIFRKNMLNKLYVLKLVSKLVMLPDDQFSTIDMVSQYFKVSYDVIKKCIQSNIDEFVENGLIFIRGEDLKNYKNRVREIISLTQNIDDYIKPRTVSLTLINKRVILNIAMFLRDSVVAKEIRGLLLDNFEAPQGLDAFQMLMFNKVCAMEEYIYNNNNSNYSPIQNSRRNPIMEIPDNIE